VIDRHLFDQLTLGWVGIAAIVFVVLFFITAPYGRHAEDAKGPKLPGRIAWLLMEAPSPIIMAACFVLGTHHRDVASWCFLALWEAHYIHRAFIFPMRLAGVPKPMPAWIALSGAGFNFVNATMNGQ
jgi:3-oxo-5-alpha-steroid 4-dehydrogenase 1